MAIGTRQSGVRRELYEPKWSTLRIPRSQTQDLVFFSQKSGIDRVSNIDQGGVISVHEGLTVYRMIFQPFYGSSEPDQIAFFRETLIELTIQKDRAYQLMLSLQASGSGFAGATSLVTQGEQAPSKANDLGEVYIGPGETFEGRLRFFRALQTANDLIASLVLESMVDEPVT